MNVLKNKYTIPLILIGFVLISMGCISVIYNHKQNADGSATVSEMVNYTGFFQQMNVLSSMNNKSNSTTDFSSKKEMILKAVCDNVTDTTVKCNYDTGKGIVTLTKDFPKFNHFYTFTKKAGLTSKIYKLTLDELPSFVKSLSGKSQKLSDGFVASTNSSMMGGNMSGGLDYLTKLGITMTYTVEMPGKITSAKDGTISKDKKSVSFDLIDMFKKKEPMVIESEEQGLFCLPSTALVLGILGLAIFKI